MTARSDITTDVRYRLIGPTVSAYAIKLRTLMRCGRIPRFAALDGSDRAALKGVLERTGCWAILNGG
ncbi:hypothetical protein [Bradyrhizobium sp. ORS 111]|uniref:hypothetical protein n=1 Tax=Bradyrhizobium sp. ORS 111 TaxID=1685958 RepID=UPI00388EBDAF